MNYFDHIFSCECYLCVRIRQLEDMNNILRKRNAEIEHAIIEAIVKGNDNKIIEIAEELKESK